MGAGPALEGAQFWTCALGPAQQHSHSPRRAEGHERPGSRGSWAETAPWEMELLVLLVGHGVFPGLWDEGGGPGASPEAHGPLRTPGWGGQERALTVGCPGGVGVLPGTLRSGSCRDTGTPNSAGESRGLCRHSDRSDLNCGPSRDRESVKCSPPETKSRTKGAPGLCPGDGTIPRRSREPLVALWAPRNHVQHPCARPIPIVHPPAVPPSVQPGTRGHSLSSVTALQPLPPPTGLGPQAAPEARCGQAGP